MSTFDFSEFAERRIEREARKAELYLNPAIELFVRAVGRLPEADDHDFVLGLAKDLAREARP